MASSSGSGSSANQTQLFPMRPPNQLHLRDCITPKRSMERILWFEKNTSRRFCNCVDWLKDLEKCNYFQWMDEELSPHYKQAMNNMKHELQQMKDRSLPGRLQRRIAELEHVVGDLKHQLEIEQVKTEYVGEELALTAASLKAVKKKFKLFVIGVMVIVVWLMMKKLF